MNDKIWCLYDKRRTDDVPGTRHIVTRQVQRRRKDGLPGKPYTLTQEIATCAECGRKKVRIIKNQPNQGHGFYSHDDPRLPTAPPPPLRHVGTTQGDGFFGDLFGTVSKTAMKNVAKQAAKAGAKTVATVGKKAISVGADELGKEAGKEATKFIVKKVKGGSGGGSHCGCQTGQGMRIIPKDWVF